jgi:hypothetical protein
MIQILLQTEINQIFQTLFVFLIQKQLFSYQLIISSD